MYAARFERKIDVMSEKGYIVNVQRFVDVNHVLKDVGNIESREVMLWGR